MIILVCRGVNSASSLREAYYYGKKAAETAPYFSLHEHCQHDRVQVHQVKAPNPIFSLRGESWACQTQRK